MTLRTAQLYGTLTPSSLESTVNVDVSFNGNVVYSGRATSYNTDEFGHSILATWTLDPAIHGEIPVTINVTGGSLTFVAIFMNYNRNIPLILQLKDEEEWPVVLPAVRDFIQTDMRELTLNEFAQKYGVDKRTMLDDYLVIANDWANSFTDAAGYNPETDSKIDVVINGVPQIRIVRDDDQLGGWHWLIPENGQVDCKYSVDPPVFLEDKPPSIRQSDFILDQLGLDRSDFPT
jgi:hypothetical protein